MAEIPKDQFQEMIKSKPADVSVQDLISSIHDQGHTVQGLDIPGAMSEEPSRAAQAWEAIKGALGTEIPGLKQAHEFMANTLPEKMAEKGGTPGAVAGALVGTAGEMIPHTMGDAAAQALAGPAIEGGTALVKGAGRIAREGYSRLTGVATPFMERAFNRPGLVTASKITQDVVDSEIENAKTILKTSLDTIGKKVGDVEDKFAMYLEKQKDRMKIPLQDLQDKIVQRMTERGSNVPKALGGQKVGIISSMAPDETSRVVDVLKTIQKNEGKMTWGDVLNLRRRVDDMIDWHRTGLPQLSSRGEATLKALRTGLNDKLYESAPGLKTANAAYSQARGAYEQLGRKIFGQNIDNESIQRRVRLMLMRGEDSSVISKRAASLGSKARNVMDKLMDSVTAQEFKPLLRKGIAGGLLGMGEAGAAYEGVRPALMGGGIGSVASTPLEAAAGIAAATSPRLAGYAMKAAGSVNQAVSPIASQIAGTIGKNLPLQGVARGAMQAIRPKGA